MERREQTRYGVRARVEFKWTGQKGILHQGRGYTRDVNSKGIFIYADAQPAAKSDIQVEVFFSSRSEAGSHLRMRAKARVIRVEPTAKAEFLGGFAALNRSYELYSGVAEMEN